MKHYETMINHYEPLTTYQTTMNHYETLSCSNGVSHLLMRKPRHSCGSISMFGGMPSQRSFERKLFCRLQSWVIEPGNYFSTCLQASGLWICLNLSPKRSFLSRHIHINHHKSFEESWVIKDMHTVWYWTSSLFPLIDGCEIHQLIGKHPIIYRYRVSTIQGGAGFHFWAPS